MDVSALAGGPDRPTPGGDELRGAPPARRSSADWMAGVRPAQSSKASSSGSPAKTPDACGTHISSSVSVFEVCVCSTVISADGILVISAEKILKICGLESYCQIQLLDLVKSVDAMLPNLGTGYCQICESDTLELLTSDVCGVEATSPTAAVALSSMY